jgi:hypothetical protein
MSAQQKGRACQPHPAHAGPHSRQRRCNLATAGGLQPSYPAHLRTAVTVIDPSEHVIAALVDIEPAHGSGAVMARSVRPAFATNARRVLCCATAHLSSDGLFDSNEALLMWTLNCCCMMLVLGGRRSGGGAELRRGAGAPSSSDKENSSSPLPSLRDGSMGGSGQLAAAWPAHPVPRAGEHATRTSRVVD